MYEKYSIIIDGFTFSKQRVCTHFILYLPVYAIYYSVSFDKEFKTVSEKKI